MTLTPSQKAAVAARGNVLVMAGAGTGKTRTLVERCLACLLDKKDPASIQQILVVTFTEAAAAEMRFRIRERLEEEMRACANTAPARLAHWQEQLALFDSAHIGTLHSFCYNLVRQHFYELELDPQLTVLAEEECRVLAEETLTGLFEKHYAGGTPLAQAVQHLVQVLSTGWDRPIKQLVLRIHNFAQTLPDPEAWLGEQAKLFASPEPRIWRTWLDEALAAWPRKWLPSLRAYVDNPVAQSCATLLATVEDGLTTKSLGKISAELVEAAVASCPPGKKTVWRKPLDPLFHELDFLASLATKTDGKDPLVEDWDWARGPMATLVALAREFEQSFTAAKKELATLDFHDLEQYTLRLLWDARASEPTAAACEWQRKLRYLFVDEYQDINAAQDKILECLSGQGQKANRFLVGDVKQSIYRFRLANPRIFQDYARTWKGAVGQSIPLQHNYRSREGILDFVNSFFGHAMSSKFGGIDYDDSARLVFGAPNERNGFRRESDVLPCVELHLCVAGKGGGGAGEEDTRDPEIGEVQDLGRADKEARLVGLRLKRLVTSGHSVWDEALSSFRPVQWSDMAVLLRSPGGKAETYAKEFARLNIPLQVARGSFYSSVEVSDTLNLLRLLDNPVQDVPLLAVLRSPLVGLSVNDLARIRLAVIKAPFWTALARWVAAERRQPSADESALETEEALAKVSLFLERFSRWRRLVREGTLTRCLDAVMAETLYGDWLRAQPRGEHRYANLQRFLDQAREFDHFQRHSLFRFLRSVEARQEAETATPAPAASAGNYVRLLSIHQSKGLEFPVVVVADLAKNFNRGDLTDTILLDDAYGLCGQIRPPHTGKRYPSLPYWLAAQRQMAELLGEELRLLYVAVTRARDLLLLTASVPRKKVDAVWCSPSPVAFHLAPPGSCADWLSRWFVACFGSAMSAGAIEGQKDFLRWQLHDETQLVLAADSESLDSKATGHPFLTNAETLELLKRELTWIYPFREAVVQPAKMSVSALRRRAALDPDESAVHRWSAPSPATSKRAREPQRGNAELAATQELPRKGVSGIDVGDAHHKFLQFVSLRRVDSEEALKAEAQRLISESVLFPEQVTLLNFKHLATFWRSGLGRRIVSSGDSLKRELAFTARFTLEELAAMGVPQTEASTEEFVVVQGIADVVMFEPPGITIMDFKTDQLSKAEVGARATAYAPQLRIYASAISRAFRQPVCECWLYFLDPGIAVPVALPSRLSSQ